MVANRLYKRIRNFVTRNSYENTNKKKLCKNGFMVQLAVI